MTQADLDALPENGGFDTVVRIIDGRKVNVPIMRQSLALFHKPNEPMQVTDHLGQRWLIGWADGVRYKSRLFGPMLR